MTGKAESAAWTGKGLSPRFGFHLGVVESSTLPQRETVGFLYQGVKDARFGPGVSGTFDQMEGRLWPGVMQVPGGAQGAGHVIAAVDDDPRNVAQPIRVTQQLAGFQPAFVQEIVVLDPGKGLGKAVLAEMGDSLRLGQKGDGPPLPGRPGAGGDKAGFPVLRGQPAAIGPQEVAAFGHRNRSEKVLPCVRENLGHAELVKPVDLCPGDGIAPGRIRALTLSGWVSA